MPVQHSPPTVQTRSHYRVQEALTSTPRVPLDGTPAVPQLRAHLERGLNMEGVAPSRKEGRGPRTQSSQHGSHQSKPSLLDIMQKVTQIMANIQASSSSEASIPPAFKTPSIKETDFLDGTKPFKVRSFIQYCHIIFHNDKGNFCKDRKKVLYATLFLTGRDAKWIEPYLSNLTNKDPTYLLNYCELFDS
ncbi:hypothetical protein O181_072957 [Austropuccinia psidii MF-1]|uniref:DUF4939 domain-containing protein n=1 Tax=Austropuccinia psidii MF-1 TaxID=1389203 RepID=A0A9Q3F853_9BASI|nr:hypothetical protein [Austropuccinia psidii MF-1]